MQDPDLCKMYLLLRKYIGPSISTGGDVPPGKARRPPSADRGGDRGFFVMGGAIWLVRRFECWSWIRSNGKGGK